MLKITTIVGNIFQNKELEKKYHDLKEHGLCESLKFTRQELEKKRLRKSTDKGSDVGLVFDNNFQLNPGDVLIADGKFILVEQIPEKIISIKIKSDTDRQLPAIIGHIIGNRHRTIAINENSISFPIQADSELELFKKLLEGIINDLELTIQEAIFTPHRGLNVHDHG